MLSFTIAKQRWERVHHEWVWMLLGRGFDLKGWGWLSLAFIAFCSFRQGYIVIPFRLPVFVVLEDISFSRLYAIHFVYNLIQSERSGYQGVQLIKLIRKFLFQNYYSYSLEYRLDIIYYGLDGTSIKYQNINKNQDLPQRYQKEQGYEVNLSMVNGEQILEVYL